VDTNTADAILPCGLAAAQIDITSSQTVGGDSWSLEQAQLSQNEAAQGVQAAPASPDSSGLPAGAMATARGLHLPFRSAIPSPVPNNAAAANGVVSGHTITSIMPLSITNAPFVELLCPDPVWRGLYSFDVVMPQTPIGNITVTATARPQAGTGVTFAYFDRNNTGPVPLNGTEALAATGIVPGDPGPPPSFACCTGTHCIVVQFPSTCVSIGAMPAPNGQPVCVGAPAPCCPADINGNGLSIQDLFDFLGFFFAADPRADFNHTGGVSVQDIFDYVGAFFAGCG
jgi:hypothetical protein